MRKGGSRGEKGQKKGRATAERNTKRKHGDRHTVGRGCVGTKRVCEHTRGGVTTPRHDPRSPTCKKRKNEVPCPVLWVVLCSLLLLSAALFLLTLELCDQRRSRLQKKTNRSAKKKKEREAERFVCFVMWRNYPLNLSISLSGGKESNHDCLSNGE